MHFALGYRHQSEGTLLSDWIGEYPTVREVYFPWPDEPSGRPVLGEDEGDDAETVRTILREELTAFRAQGLALDLLLNANCYGSAAISVALESHVRSILDELSSWGTPPAIVTTASPFIARTLKAHYPQIEVRASVNMRLTTLSAMAYLAPWFDSYYLGRDVQRNLDTVRRVADWCHARGKKVGILANSGCLRNCPWQTFHDNLIAHSAHVRQQANVRDFNPHLCWTLYRDQSNFPEILKATWIRPEDLHHYEGLVDFVKLATRQHQKPRLVVDAYTTGSFCGNLLDLFEPGFAPAFAPLALDNTRFPADWFATTAGCSNACTTCTYCARVFAQVT